MNTIKTIDQYTKLKYDEDVKTITKRLQIIEKYIKSHDEILEKKKQELAELKKQAETLDKLKKFINV